MYALTCVSMYACTYEIMYVWTCVSTTCEIMYVHTMHVCIVYVHCTFELCTYAALCTTMPCVRTMHTCIHGCMKMYSHKQVCMRASKYACGTLAHTHTHTHTHTWTHSDMTQTRRMKDQHHESWAMKEHPIFKNDAQRGLCRPSAPRPFWWSFWWSDPKP